MQDIVSIGKPPWTRSEIVDHLDVYYEFPPVIKSSKTRWGDAWSNASYPTTKLLLEEPGKSTRKLFVDEAVFYT